MGFVLQNCISANLALGVRSVFAVVFAPQTRISPDFRD